MEGKLIKVDFDSPKRCQAIAQHGQCVYQVVEGITYCPMHAGAAQNEIQKQKLRNYRLQKYRERINEKADSDVIKSLREEIGILRMIMEEVINRCTDDTDLIIYSPKITDLALKIEKVVVSCHKLETSLDENIINVIIEEIGHMITE